MWTFSSRQLLKILAFRGPNTELLKAVEELGELEREILKGLQNKPDVGHISEEIADVYIMIEHVKNIYNIQDVWIQDIIRRKLNREEMRINKERRNEDR